MSLSLQDIEKKIIGKAEAQALARLNLPADHIEIRGDTVVVRAGCNELTYQIFYGHHQLEVHGVLYEGTDTYDVREIEARKIPFWRRWLARTTSSS